MNVIIDNGNVLPTDQATLFVNEEVITIKATEYSVLLRDLGIYKSASIARKAGRFGEIPKGWNVLKASKKVELFLWNPTELE